MTRKRRLTLVLVGDGVAPDVANELADRLADRLNLRVRVERDRFAEVRENAADQPCPAGNEAGGPPGTQQLSSNDLADALAHHFREERVGWVLGITGDDLTAEGRSCVFGEAMLGGRWAVISAARFGPREGSSPRMLDRLYREAVHEIGHLAGLEHCPGTGPCVMQIAASVPAIDAGSSEFCPRCEAEFLEKQVEG